MPFYEYQCSACGAQVEVLQKISDAPLRKCAECGRNKLTKLVSAPVFRLKGGGWYETDFKTDQDRKRNLVDNDRDSGGKEAKSEGSSDAASGTDSGAKPEKPGAAEKSATPDKPAKPGPVAGGPAAKPAARRAATARKPAAAAKPKAAAKSKATTRARV